MSTDGRSSAVTVLPVGTDVPSQRYLELLKQTLTASIYPESAGRIIERPLARPIRHPVTLFRNTLRSWFIEYCRRRSVVLIKKEPFDQKLRDSGLDWPLFAYTMTGRKRLDNLEFCVQEILANDVPGDLVETGVWRGGSVIFMRALLQVYGVTDRIVWAADSFDGMPSPISADDGLDLSRLNYLRVSLEDVQRNFERFGLLDDQVRFLAGWFADTLPAAPIERIALLRLDGDLYSSTMDALVSLCHRVSPGGYVVVDDYYSWESCRRAVTDYRALRGITAELCEIDGSAVFWKVE